MNLFSPCYLTINFHPVHEKIVSSVVVAVMDRHQRANTRRSCPDSGCPEPSHAVFSARFIFYEKRWEPSAPGGRQLLEQTSTTALETRDEMREMKMPLGAPSVPVCPPFRLPIELHQDHYLAPHQGPDFGSAQSDKSNSARIIFAIVTENDQKCKHFELISFLQNVNHVLRQILFYRQSSGRNECSFHP